MEGFNSYIRINTNELEKYINKKVEIIGFAKEIYENYIIIEGKNQIKIKIENIIDIYKTIKLDSLIEIKGEVTENNVLKSFSFNLLPNNNFNLEVFENSLKIYNDLLIK